MARLSVYIPDELLERARARDESANVSQLVQSGLRLLVGSERVAPVYEDVPEGSAVKLLELREHFLPLARVDYRAGYEIAQDAASCMPLQALDALARSGFDVERWIVPYRRGYGQELVDRTISRRSETDAKAPESGPSAEDGIASADYWRWLVRSAAALGDLADPIGFDEFSFTPSHARVRGYADALREVWSELEEQSRQEQTVREHES
jgi:hypothetical protein